MSTLTSPRHGAGTRAGLTLVEMLVAASVLGLMLGAIATTLHRGDAAYRAGVSAAVVDTDCRRMLDRLASEFRDADRSSLNPNPTSTFWTSTIDFARVSGVAAGAAVLGPTRRLQLALEVGELDNGVDDNGNGLIDERRLVLVPDVGTPGESVVIGKYVRERAEGELVNGLDDNANGISDEAGLWFLHDGNGTLTIGVTIERLDTERRLITRSLRTAVRMRND